MLYLLWLGCSSACPDGSALKDDGLCHLDETGGSDTAVDTDTGSDTDTGDPPLPDGDCPDEPSTDTYERYPVYIEGGDRRFVSIQDAIWGAEEGDVVTVCPGTYYETINFKGKIITVRSAAGARQTTIDAQQKGSVVVLRLWEPEETVLEGFTLTGGNAWVGKDADGHGGGIYVEWGNPTIRHNIIVDNEAKIAGGVYVRNGGAHVSNNIIARNSASENGGGIVCTACYGEYTFNTLYQNGAPRGPAGEWFWGISDLVGNIVVSDDIAGVDGAFLYMMPRGKDFSVSHNLLWPHADFTDPDHPDSDAWPAQDTVLADPVFADPDAGDFRLSSGSAAIDAGPDGILDADGSPADLGAFGGPLGDWGD